MKRTCGYGVKAAGRGGTRGFFRLCMEHGGIGGGATEQGPGIEADALDTTIEQQTIEPPLGVPLGEELIVTDLHCQWALQGVDEARQFRQPIRRKRLGQLQPERRNPFAQRAEQLHEGVDSRLVFAQIAVVANVAGEFGGEAKVLGHGLGPALHDGRGRARVESRIAFHGVEYLGIETQEFGASGVLGIEIIAPGVFAPGGAAEVVRQRHQM